jgi:hypothetical protein
MLPQLEAIPPPLRDSERLLVWNEITDEKGRKRKTPISKSGLAIGYNNPDAIMSVNEVKCRLEKDEGLGAGISLLDGLETSIGEHSGFVHSLDFDGFADFESTAVDSGVLKFFRLFPGYCEVSPSGTGFKVFFVSDRLPETKFKIGFSPSEFATKYPEIRKYQHREIEVFSKNCFLALTGDIFSSHTTKLHYMESSKADEMYAYLNDWAISTGGKGREAKPLPKSEPRSSDTEVLYIRLTQPSLETVLTHIDHTDEQVWTDTGNALARAYGEDGRPYFLSYSAGDYCNEPYENYDETECNDRFDRALAELDTRPNGYGVKHLVETAQHHPKWLCPTLKYEDDTIYDSIVWATPELKSQDTQTDTSTPTPYTFLTTEELKQLPPTKWRVKGLFPDQGLASIYGPSGSGKSFLALDLMAAVACGSAFYGHKTTSCPVVYVALEGTGGIAKRVEAYETHHKIKLPTSFRIVTDMLSLFSSEASVFAEAVIEAGLNEGVIVIDTLAQSAPGSDENSSAHMGMIISNAQLLQRMTNGLVVLIHHTGKDASRGARGHSSLYAALDAALEVKRTQGGLEWLSAKVKDGASGNATSFRLERVVLGQDEDGDEISSCVAVGDLFRKTPLTQPTGKNQKAVLDALLFKFGAGTTVATDKALDIAKASLTGQTTNTAQRAKEALEGLLEIGRLVLTNDKYALV